MGSGAVLVAARPPSVTIDIDATLITAHFEKKGARGSYKGGLEDACAPALDQDGPVRADGEIAAITYRVNLSS